MRLKPFRQLLLSLFGLLALTACQNREAATSPAAAVRQSVALIRAGDFAGFWKHALPPADYATLRADWSRPHPGQAPITAADRAQFARTLQQLTAPDAETRLYRQLQPKLIETEQKYRDQLPLLIGIGQSMLKTAVAKSEAMTAAQKQQADAVLDVLGPWAQHAPWFDQDKARLAIGTIVGTARKLDLKSPDALRTMDFDTAMRESAVGYAGIRQLLELYGLSLDAVLDSVRVTTLSNHDGHARVRIDYTLLGKPLSTESALVEQDGHWYSEDLLQNVRQSHRQPAPPTAITTPAAASTARAAATKH